MANKRDKEKNFVDRANKALKKKEFPIEDRAALARALGGEDGRVEWEGQSYEVRQVIQIVPDYLFPSSRGASRSRRSTPNSFASPVTSPQTRGRARARTVAEASHRGDRPTTEGVRAQGGRSSPGGRQA